ncbi:acryloyl-CoA reductase [Spirosoma sp. KCTC 42546]|uniref:YhdH/YhfP family quinone oxidoreductase n=1 Tax=Spirosoma sp. KCTC 42546 TaxID=2520506 RepID=UPI00115AE4FF|nr:YhdH/YhfP family quinone oxidoreductase [Spirosoma sp. KCTC 42546]QDK77813.1 acryloyl-CoA reductase [Spirosoma sp. KCTC 42546]
MTTEFQCLQVSETEPKQFNLAITTKHIDELPAGDVLIRIWYSSLNYKDALSASGNRGVTRNYPHTPGIDAAGIVEESTDERWKAGDQVIVTGFDLGMNTSGGFSQYIRVPGNWIVKLPDGMTLRESMMYGTAGFTAGLSVQALIKNGITPEKGPIVVTGATGGVGSVAVAILAQLGYAVSAVSSKESANDFLTALGATELIPRSDMEDQTGKILLKQRFAGAVDTVGGLVLATVLKSLNYGGVATCCGMVNGGELPTTVFPFILRGVQLAGIDSVEHPIDQRPSLWELLATDWKPAGLESLVHELSLAEVPDAIQTILQGKMQGRVVIRVD